MPAILREGDRLGHRFRVVGSKPIGQGQFAEVYRAVDEGPVKRESSNGGRTGATSTKHVAVKIERRDQTSTRERRALVDLQGCKGVVEYIEHGVHGKRNHPFIVMSLVGENLADVRRDKCGNHHSLMTIGWIGARMLEILRGMHERGYVHRDVKPSNVALGGGIDSNAPGASSLETRKLYLIDLGLAKKFETAPPAPGTSAPLPFRGSTTYASVSAHAGEEQGPRDDLWSLLYLLVECHEGTLPWRKVKEKAGGAAGIGEEDGDGVKAEIHALKLACIRDPQNLCPTRGTPQALIDFSRALERVPNSAQMPDYEHLRTLMASCAGSAECINDYGGSALDWEVNPVAATSEQGTYGGGYAAGPGGTPFGRMGSAQGQSRSGPHFSAAQVSNAGSSAQLAPGMESFHGNVTPLPPPRMMGMGMGMLGQAQGGWAGMGGVPPPPPHVAFSGGGGVGGTLHHNREPDLAATLVGAVHTHPERISSEVMAEVKRLGQKFDIEKVFTIFAGCAAAVVESHNTEDSVIAELVENCLADFQSVVDESRAKLRGKRQRRR